MITELTEEQKNQLKVYRDKGIAAGIDTTPISGAEVRTVVEGLYEHILQKDMPRLEIHLSPHTAWQAVKDHAGEEMEYVPPYIEGHLDSYFFSYYDYMHEVLGVEYDCMPAYEALRGALKIGHLYPMEDVCIISLKPVEIHMVSDKYHCETGPAVLYGDGEALYMLNGVNVPKWLVMTPRKELEALKFATIKNVEVRREFVRKIGVERLVEQLNCEVLDKEDDYELLLVDLGGETGKWPYLKMKNPSIDVWHVEAVGEGISTVANALTWRNQTTERPTELT